MLWPWRSQSLLTSLSGKFLCSVELWRSRVISLRSPCLTCFVERSAWLWHVMACAVSMEIPKSACITFWEISLLRQTSMEQGRLPKKPMSDLFCGAICLPLSCDGLCGGHGDHKVCLFLGSFFAPSNSDGAGSPPQEALVWPVFVEGSACLRHATTCVVAMEITKSACLTFWEVSSLRRTLAEQGHAHVWPVLWTELPFSGMRSLVRWPWRSQSLLASVM